MGNSWYVFKNLANGQAEIALFDEIGAYGVTAAAFIAELQAVKGKKLNLRIHSPGGEIFDGNAIYNALRRHAGGVDVFIDGLAASMASVIAMVGDKRSMAENAYMMIHNPWSVAFGESSDMRKSADLLDSLKETIISAYAGRVDVPREKISSMMDDETWMTAVQAKYLGFVTDITEPLSMKNSFHFDMGKFAKSPKAFLPTKPAPAPEAVSVPEVPKPDALKAKFQNLTAELKNRVKERDDYRAAIKRGEFLLDAMQHSMGLAPARVVVNCPTYRERSSGSVFEHFCEIKDSEEKARFYAEHREELARYVNKPTPESNANSRF